MKLFSLFLAKNGSCSHPDACGSFARFSADEFGEDIERTRSRVFHCRRLRRRRRTKIPRRLAVEYSLDEVNECVSPVVVFDSGVGSVDGEECSVAEEFRHSTPRRCSVVLVGDSVEHDNEDSDHPTRRHLAPPYESVARQSHLDRLSAAEENIELPHLAEKVADNETVVLREALQLQAIVNKQYRAGESIYFDWCVNIPDGELAVVWDEEYRHLVVVVSRECTSLLRVDVDCTCLDYS